MGFAFLALLLLSVGGLSSAQQKVFCDLCRGDGVGHLVYGYAYDVAWAYEACCAAGGCSMDVQGRTVHCNTTLGDVSDISLFERFRLMDQLESYLYPYPCPANETESTCPPVYTVNVEAPDDVQPPPIRRPVSAMATCSLSCSIIGLQ